MDRKNETKFIISIIAVLVLAAGVVADFYFGRNHVTLSNPGISEQGERNLNLITTKLATIPAEYHKASLDIYFSATGRKVVYEAIRNGYHIFIGDTEGVPYDFGSPEQFDKFEERDAPRIVFSSDDTRVVYLASRNGKDFLVIDGEESVAYDEIGYFAFSDDSQHIAYAAKEGKKWFLVLDGKKKDESYRRISTLRFRPERNEVTYIAKMKGGEVFVIGDQLGEPYDDVGGDSDDEFQISRDGSVVAYEAIRENDDVEGKTVVNWNGGKIFEGFFAGMSLDGESVAYIVPTGQYVEEPAWARAELRKLIIETRDGEKSSLSLGTASLFSEGESIYSPRVIFSPDGKHFAYALLDTDFTKRPAKHDYYVIIDGDEGKHYGFVDSQIIFSPDGRKLAYVASEEYSLAKADAKKFVVINTQGQPQRYKKINTPVIFSPDSKRLAYVASNDWLQKGDDPWTFSQGAQFVVVDGQEGKHYTGALMSPPVFSPDSKHVAYIVAYQYVDRKEAFLVLDGEEGKQYEFIDMKLGPVFGPDSKKVAYGAKLEDGLWWIVEDL